MTTQEIVKVLKCCTDLTSPYVCERCLIRHDPLIDCNSLRRQAADLIESLEAELEQAKRERNAAIKNANSCRACKHAKPWKVNSSLVSCDKLNINKIATGCPYFEWRGPCAQNGGAE